MSYYTVSEAAKRCGLSAHTLRYYDKVGILPFVGRDSSGVRRFQDGDFGWLQMICCLKDTGMPLKKIKVYIDMAMQGDELIGERLDFLREHKREVERQRAELDRHLELIDHKISHCEAAITAGRPKAGQRDVAGGRVENPR